MARYRLDEAAIVLGVGSATLRGWIDAGRLVVVRDGRGRECVDGATTAQVDIQAGPFRIVSVIGRETAGSLGQHVGVGSTARLCPVAVTLTGGA